MKASTLCAGSALLVLGGFMSVNLAGCGGGGGGGGGIGSPTSTPSPQSITFRLQQQDGTASVGGSLSLSQTAGGTVIASGTADSTGVATIASVPAGTYVITFTTVDSTGASTTTVTSNVVITRSSGQSFRLIEGNTTTGTYTVSGRVFANPNNESTPNCPTGTPAITDTFLVSVIDLDPLLGRPIIAQVRRARQSASTPSATKGAYTIVLPYRPANFQVQIGQYDTSGAQYGGISATTNFRSGDSVINVNVCANNDGTIPRATPTAHPTPTVTFTFIPPRTGTAIPTITPSPTPTATAVPTATSTPTQAPTPTTVPTIGF